MKKIFNLSLKNIRQRYAHKTKPDSVTTTVMQVDAHIPRDPCADARPVTRVAVGVLQRADGCVLLTSRPPGKVYAGYWEFPGGKLQAGESVLEALQRELYEELGVQIDTCTTLLWKQTRADYPHALVELNFCKVFVWQDVLQMREGQQYTWQHLPVQISPLLPATAPILEWLHAEKNGAKVVL